MANSRKKERKKERKEVKHFIITKDIGLKFENLIKDDDLLNL